MFKWAAFFAVRQDQELVPCKPCEAFCNCLVQIHSDMRETVRYFSSVENPPEDIAVAILECFKAMLSFDYASEFKLCNCSCYQEVPLCNKMWKMCKLLLWGLNV